MSKDEARFWFEVLVSIDREKTPQKRAEELKKKKLGTLGVDAALKALKKARSIGEDMVIVLTAMFGADAVTDMLITDKPSSDGWIAGGSFFQGWHQHVLPLLSDADREKLKKLVGDTGVDLFAIVPTGKGAQTYLRTILLVIDHNAYHLGQLVAVRRALGMWK